MNQQNNFEDDAQTNSLADLTLTGEQASGISAGQFAPYGNFRGGVRVAVGDVEG
jgi:hypothetical protein